MSFWASGAGIAAIGGLASVGGGLISASGTRAAQNKANDLAAQQAAAAQKQQWDQYLLSRGINPGSLPGIPGGTGSYVNTVLPVGATINGNPAEQVILNTLFGRSGLAASDPSVYSSDQNINAFLQANPSVLQEITDAMSGSDDQRSPAQWLHDHVTQTEASVGGGTFTNHLKDFATSQAGGGQGGGGAGGGTMSGTVPPEIAALNQSAINSIGKIYNGGFLQNEMDALKDITGARTDLAKLGYDRNNELRSGSANVLNTGLSGLNDVLNARNTGVSDVLNTQLSGLDNLLGVKRDAAGNILSTQLGGLANLRGVQEHGANDIYGAEMLGADTYENAVKQAVSRTLSEQQARRALQGFNGSSSGDALLRARTYAGGYQQAGGARAQAGINLQKLLSDARSAEALGQLGARSNNANLLGDANISDSTGRLNANTLAAQGRSGALESDALGRLGLKMTNANTLAGILDSDVAGNIAKANLQNAGDRASLIGADINRQIGSGGLANNLYGSTLNLTNAAAGAKYADLNALMQSLGFVKQNQPPTPQPIIPNQGSVLNGGQILGSGLSTIGSGVMDYYNTQNLLKLISGNNNKAAGTVSTNELGS